MHRAPVPCRTGDACGGGGCPRDAGHDALGAWISDQRHRRSCPAAGRCCASGQRRDVGPRRAPAGSGRGAGRRQEAEPACPGARSGRPGSRPVASSHAHLGLRALARRPHRDGFLLVPPKRRHRAQPSAMVPSRCRAGRARRFQRPVRRLRTADAGSPPHEHARPQHGRASPAEHDRTWLAVPVLLAGLGLAMSLVGLRDRRLLLLAGVALVNATAYVLTPGTGTYTGGCLPFLTRFSTPSLALTLVAVPIFLSRFRAGAWQIYVLALFAIAAILTMPLSGTSLAEVVATVLVVVAARSPATEPRFEARCRGRRRRTRRCRSGSRIRDRPQYLRDRYTRGELLTRICHLPIGFFGRCRSPVSLFRVPRRPTRSTERRSNTASSIAALTALTARSGRSHPAPRGNAGSHSTESITSSCHLTMSKLRDGPRTDRRQASTPR